MMNACLINKRLLEQSIIEHKMEKQQYWTKNVDPSKMVYNYKKKIENFIQISQDHPYFKYDEDLQENTFKNYTTRKIDISKHKGPKSIQVTDKYNQYIEKQVVLNNLLDTCPVKQIRNIVRTQNKNLQIQKNMRFTAQTQMERVLDSFNQNGFGKLDSYDMNQQYREYKPIIKRNLRYNSAPRIKIRPINPQYQDLTRNSSIEPSPTNGNMKYKLYDLKFDNLNEIPSPILKKERSPEKNEQHTLNNSLFLDQFKTIHPQQFMKNLHQKSYLKATKVIAQKLPIFFASDKNVLDKYEQVDPNKFAPQAKNSVLMAVPNASIYKKRLQIK